MSAHLDLDALADLLAGEGDDGAVAHLEGCAGCSTRLADLDAATAHVGTLLAQEAARPVPAAPADLEQRLQERLAAVLPGTPEAVPAGAVPQLPDQGTSDHRPVHDTTTHARSGDVLPQVLPGGVVPLGPRRRPGSSRVLQAAAGGVAVLALAGLGLGLLRSGAGGADESSGPAGAAAGAAAPLPDLPVSSTGTDYRRDGDQLARALPALLSSTGSAADSGLAAGSGGDPRIAAQEGGTAADTVPGTDAGSGSSGGGVAEAPAAGAARAQEGVPGAAAAQDSAPTLAAVDPLARLRDPEELAGCLAELTGPDGDDLPLALDYAAFEGRPALVVVLPSARQGKVDVFAVGAGCRAGDDQTLFFTRLDRP